MARQFGESSEKGQLARDMRLRQMEDDEEKRRKIERYVSIAFVVFGVLFLVFSIISYNSYKKKSEQGRVELSEVQETLDKMRSAVNDDTTTVVEVDAVVASASEAGEAVCKAQNDIDTAKIAEMKVGATGMSDAHVDAINRVRRYIVVDNGNSSGISGSWSKYGPKGVWEFNGTYEFEGTNMTVVWKYYAPDDIRHERLLAFATAFYNSDDNMFHDGDIYYTTWYSDLAKDFLTETPVDDSDAVGEPDPDVPSLGTGATDVYGTSDDTGTTGDTSYLENSNADYYTVPSDGEEEIYNGVPDEDGAPELTEGSFSEY